MTIAKFFGIRKHVSVLLVFSCFLLLFGNQCSRSDESLGNMMSNREYMDNLSTYSSEELDEIEEWHLRLAREIDLSKCKGGWRCQPLK
jgi:hypothetical protein